MTATAAAPAKGKEKEEKKEEKKEATEKKTRSKYSEYDFSGIAKKFKNKDDIAKEKTATQVIAILTHFHGKGKLTVKQTEDEMNKLVESGGMKTRQPGIRVFNYYRNTGHLADHGVEYL